MVREVKNVHDDVITGLQYLPDGGQLITVSRDNTIKLIDLRTFSVVCSFEHEKFFNSTDTNSIAVSCNGAYAAVGSKNGNLLIFNLHKEELEEMFEGEHTNRIVGCAWQRKNGNKIATIDAIGNLFIWE